MRHGRRQVALAVDDADDVLRVDLKDLRDAPRTWREDGIVLGVLWQDSQLASVVDARALAAACANTGTTGAA